MIEQAQIAQSVDGVLSTTKQYLPGYDGTVSLPQISWLLFRLGVVLYLVASALSRFDRANLNTFDIGLRFVLAVLVILKAPTISTGALIVTALYLAYHHLIVARKHNAAQPQGS